MLPRQHRIVESRPGREIWVGIFVRKSVKSGKCREYFERKTATVRVISKLAFFVGARDETRTHTLFTVLAPETSASTIPPPALEWTAKIQQFLQKTTKLWKNLLSLAVHPDRRQATAGEVCS